MTRADPRRTERASAKYASPLMHGNMFDVPRDTEETNLCGSVDT